MIPAAWTTLLRSDPHRRGGADTAAAEPEGRLAALERALAVSERERTRLAALNDSRSAFLLAVLRDLRAPLVDVLAQTRPSVSAPSDSRLRENLRDVGRTVAELTALIDDTADFVAANRSPPAARLQRVDARLAAQRACDALARRAEASAVTLSCSPPAAGLVVMADPEALGGALRGLLADAIRHARSGGGARIEATREADWVILTVRSDGPSPDPARLSEDGLDAEGRLIPRLGFAAAQKRVEALGGSLSMLAPSGRGTALSLRLPAAGPGSAARLSGAEVLVVGADLADLGVMRRIVTESGGRLHAARTPQAGLPLARDLDPDLLVLDLTRAPERGLALKVRLDADPLLHRTPVVALVCTVSEAERRRIDAAGFVACLSRPLDPAALADTLGEAIARTRRSAPLDADRTRGA